jgi:hypothetical protein
MKLLDAETDIFNINHHECVDTVPAVCHDRINENSKLLTLLCKKSDGNKICGLTSCYSLIIKLIKVIFASVYIQTCKLCLCETV